MSRPGDSIRQAIGHNLTQDEWLLTEVLAYNFWSYKVAEFINRLHKKGLYKDFKSSYMRLMNGGMPGPLRFNKAEHFPKDKNAVFILLHKFCPHADYKELDAIWYVAKTHSNSDVVLAIRDAMMRGVKSVRYVNAILAKKYANTQPIRLAQGVNAPIRLATAIDLDVTAMEIERASSQKDR